METPINPTKLINAEIEMIRSQTKACQHIIHFNNAGASLPADEVTKTVIDYLLEEAACGGYETEAKYIDQINKTYDLIAQLIGAGKDEVAIFENASAAWGTAFKGLKFEKGDEIVTCEMEYVTNLIGFVDIQKSAGVVVKVIPNDSDGNISLAELEKAISDRTKLIAVTHIASSGGAIAPVVAIGKIAKKHNVLYMVDACQSAGHLPLDVEEIQCDILSATGRKYMRAPRGTGFLYVRKLVQDRITPMLLDFQAAGNVSLTDYTLRNDARRYELYEKNRALVLGLGKAIQYMLSIGLDRIWERISDLATFARFELSKLDGVVLHDAGKSKSGIVTFSIKGMDSAVVKAKLAEFGINVSIGGQQATPIYMENQHLFSVVRASLHYYNTEEEISTMIERLGQIILEN